jgi:DNA replication protein DnaC
VSADANGAALQLSCYWCHGPAAERGWCEAHLAEVRERERLAAEDDVRRRRLELLEAIGVPVGLQDATFATSNPTRSIELVRAFRNNGRGRLLGLLGPTGIGKSWAVAALIDDVLVDLRTSTRWLLFSTLARELRDFKLADQAMARACSGRLVVIDDFQQPTPEISSAMEEIFCRREQDKRALILTSNLTRKELELALSDRVVDRFRSWGELFEVRGGKSLRG